MYLGLFGTYRKNETVDVEYRRGGKMQLVSDAEILPAADLAPSLLTVGVTKRWAKGLADSASAPRSRLRPPSVRKHI